MNYPRTKRCNITLQVLPDFGLLRTVTYGPVAHNEKTCDLMDGHYMTEVELMFTADVI
jgi:hypothetical protein